MLDLNFTCRHVLDIINDFKLFNLELLYWKDKCGRLYIFLIYFICLMNEYVHSLCHETISSTQDYPVAAGIY